MLNSIALLDIALETHAMFLKREDDLSSLDNKELIRSLQGLKNKLDFNAGSMHVKVAAQLLVFLFPSAVRSIVNKDPVEFLVPIGMMAADAAVREVLLKLMKHPQLPQIFSGRLASKVLAIVDPVMERVPLIGSALAVYGLIQSGKALITSDSQDPNRPYYAHLLANNLITLEVMGAEAVVSLPFWPVLALFSVLTLDQVMTEGRRVHDVVLHLQDDNDHPLLKYTRVLQLGLGIVPSDIAVSLEQRQLFQSFLNYLESSKNANHALVAVTIPAVRRIEERKPIFLTKGKKVLGCLNYPSNYKPSVYPKLIWCARPVLVVDKEADFSFELGKTRQLCEKRDSFYSEDSHSHYSLWVGTLSDCSLGRETRVPVLAKTNNLGVAGILVNTQFKASSESNDYNLFLAIDPSFTRNYSLTLQHEASGVIAASFLSRYLPCAMGIAHCIKKITVLITKIYLTRQDESHRETRVIVNDDELKRNSSSQGVQAIEYLLATNNPITIVPNQILAQSFIFSQQLDYLRFQDRWLMSIHGSQIPLAGIKKLSLQLTDKVWVEGTFIPEAEQQLIIYHLQGRSEEKIAALDLRQCQSFSISLGQYTRLIGASHNLTIYGNLKTSILEAYSYGKVKPNFYQLLTPMNNMVVNATQEQNLYLSIVDDQREEVASMRLTAKTENISQFFSGHYVFNNQMLFSRIVMAKTGNEDWNVALEINASMTNTTLSIFDLRCIQKQNFSKLSVLVNDSDSFKLIHYFFYHEKGLSVINGKFIDYRLQGSTEGWCLILKHEQPNEKTHIFLAENVQEIIIDTLRYKLEPALGALFIIGTVDDTPMQPINCKNLLAPLKVETPFAKTEISITNTGFQVGNLYFSDRLSKAIIYFDDQRLPLAYIKYLLETNPPRPLSIVVSAAHLDSSQMVIEKENISSRRHRRSQAFWLERVNRYLLGGAALAATVISTTFFMVIKRFKRSSTLSNVVYHLANTVPLAESLSVSTLSGPENTQLWNRGMKSNICMGVERVSLNQAWQAMVTGNARFFDESRSTPTIARLELNSQLVLADYLIRHVIKTKAKKVDSNSRCYANKYKAANFPFYAHSISANADRQEIPETLPSTSLLSN